MDLYSTRICRLCLESNDHVVNIFEKFQNSTIASVVTQHFWFQVSKDDGFSEYLCQICWINTKTFHNFYKRVERRQKDNWQLAVVQSHVIKQEPSEQEVDLTLVKNEITDPPVPVINFPISREESSDYTDNYSCDPSENQITGIDGGGSNLTENTSPVPAENASESNEEEDSDEPDEPNLNLNFQGISLSEKNAKIREFFSMACHICSAPFETFGKAKKHYRVAHNVPGYVYCCGRKFHRHSNALSHIFYHLNPDAYRCDTCDKRFSDKVALQKHIKNHKPDDSLEYKCDICTNKSYRKSIYLAQHMRLKHCSEEDKKFHCDKCKRKFVSQSLLTYHIRVDHDLVFTQVCDICAKVFKHKSILRMHMKVHSTVPQQKVQCNICGTWLKNENGLRHHLKRHQDTTAECSICSKVLQNKFSLGNHIRRAHGERRHQCPFCDKKFKTPVVLKEHIAGHTGQDLYECPYCPKTFKSSANMFSHRKKAHFEEWTRNRKEVRKVEQTSTKLDPEKLHS